MTDAPPCGQLARSATSMATVIGSSRPNRELAAVTTASRMAANTAASFPSLTSSRQDADKAWAHGGVAAL